MRLRQFRFTIGSAPADDQVEQLLRRADDASVEVVPATGELWVAFDRDAPTLIDAVVSGVRDLDVAGIGPIMAVDDDPVVSLATIAERAGRPLEIVRGWADGPGFPAPVEPHPRRPVYDWVQVAGWLREGWGFEPPEPAVTLHAVTLALQLRALAPELERMAPIRALLYT